MELETSRENYFIGIDLHSTQFTCCFLNEKSDKFEIQYPVSDEGIEKFLLTAGKKSTVMVEASSGTFEFVYRIRDRVKEVFVANPHKLKLISMVKKKTDKVDAEKLALFLKMQIMSGEELIKSVFVPEKTIKELRSLFTTYEMFTNIIVQLKNSIHGILKQNLICIPRNSLTAKTKRAALINSIDLAESTQIQLQILLVQLEQTEANLDKIEQQIKLIGSDYQKEINILTSMKGISIIMALALIADIADISRFPNSKHMASYLRSTPSVDSSNDVIKIGRTNKFGRKLSVSLLTQSVLHFRQADPHLNNWYTTKGKAKGKGKMRMAVMRKIFTQIYHMLKKEEYHWQRDAMNHERKMKAYDKFLIKNGKSIEKAA